MRHRIRRSSARVLTIGTSPEHRSGPRPLRGESVGSGGRPVLHARPVCRCQSGKPALALVWRRLTIVIQTTAPRKNAGVWALWDHAYWVTPASTSAAAAAGGGPIALPAPCSVSQARRSPPGLGSGPPGRVDQQSHKPSRDGDPLHDAALIGRWRPTYVVRRTSPVSCGPIHGQQQRGTLGSCPLWLSLCAAVQSVAEGRVTEWTGGCYASYHVRKVGPESFSGTSCRQRHLERRSLGRCEGCWRCRRLQRNRERFGFDYPTSSTPPKAGLR